MNNTTKAKYDFARRMLKGKIEPEEVAMMTELPLDEIIKLDEEINPKNTDAEIIKAHDNVDFNIGPLLYDNNPAETPELEGFSENWERED